MKRLIFIAIYSVVTVGVILWLVSKSKQLLFTNEERDLRVGSLPALRFTSIDERSLVLSAVSGTNGLALIAFNSECEHCQYEAKSISSIVMNYENTRFVFLSEEPLDTIRQFQNTYFPAEFSNVTFGQVSIVDLHDTFGSISYPNIFIYGKDGKLLREFKGETKPEAIEAYLK